MVGFSIASCPPQRLFERVRRRREESPLRNGGIKNAKRSDARLGRVELKTLKAVFRAFGFQALQQLGSFFFRQERFLFKLEADDSGVIPRRFFLLLIVELCGLERAVQRPLHLNREPVLDAAGQKAAGDDEEQDGRDRSETDERGDQLAPEAGSERLPAAFEIMLDQVPGQQQSQQDQQDQVQLEQRQNQNIAREKRRGFDLAEIEDGQSQGQAQKTERDPDRPRMAAFLLFVR